MIGYGRVSRRTYEEAYREKNNEISYEQAQTCVELLWEDFEATYAKAGHKYAGKEMTFRVVDQVD